MTTLTGARHAAGQGASDMSPLMLGMAPFGMVAGIAAVEAGVRGGPASSPLSSLPGQHSWLRWS